MSEEVFEEPHRKPRRVWSPVLSGMTFLALVLGPPLLLKLYFEIYGALGVAKDPETLATYTVAALGSVVAFVMKWSADEKIARRAELRAEKLAAFQAALQTLCRDTPQDLDGRAGSPQAGSELAFLLLAPPDALAAAGRYVRARAGAVGAADRYSALVELTHSLRRDLGSAPAQPVAGPADIVSLAVVLRAPAPPPGARDIEPLPRG